jgi:lysophospholipase L1-like esterase
MNGLLFTTVLAIAHQQSNSSQGLYAARDLSDPLVIDAAIADNIPELPHPSGGRKLSYEQWLALLADDAKTMAVKDPDHLSVLLGDSLSLWFPGELMPGRRVWINQSISGERTKGLLDRLDFLKDNNVEAVFLMIGINDLIWGESDEAILTNYKEIVLRLKQAHPETQIVVQSILPHGGENSTWESRDKLAALPSERIQKMNDSLREIASDNQAYYLDLYPIFVTGEGTLRPDLTTDGLHLNRQGYLVWRSAIALYAQLELQ